VNLLRIAIQSIAANGIRAVLSLLALCLSVVGVVTVASAADTVEKTVTLRATMQNGPIATYRVTGLAGTAGAAEADAVQRYLAAVMTDAAVVEVAGLESIAVDYNETATPMPVEFASDGYLSIHPYGIVSGQWPDGPSRAPVIRVALNTVAADQLGVDIGASIRLRVPGASTAVPATVVGIVSDGGFDAHAYAPLADGAAFLAPNAGELATRIELSAPASNLTELTQAVAQYANVTGSTTPIAVEQVDTVRRLAQEVTATRSAFFVVGGLGLAAGILAVANVGLSSLRERSSELALRRVLGARRWHLAVLMLVESQLIAIVASVLAIGISILVYPSIAATFGAPYGVATPAYPWQSAILGIVTGMGAGLLGSLAPAARSLRIGLSSVTRA
jgi:putative ABC transport system permease protein